MVLFKAMKLRRFTFEGCPKTSERPFSEGWAELVAWGPGIPDGLYCKEYTAAIEAIEADIGAEYDRLRRPRGTRRRPK
jgi:hypothetical protein